MLPIQSKLYYLCKTACWLYGIAYLAGIDEDEIYKNYDKFVKEGIMTPYCEQLNINKFLDLYNTGLECVSCTLNEATQPVVLVNYKYETKHHWVTYDVTNKTHPYDTVSYCTATTLGKIDEECILELRKKEK